MSQLCKREKPDTESYILYDFMSVDFWKRHNYSQRYICGCQGIGVEERVWWQIPQGSIFEHLEFFYIFIVVAFIPLYTFVKTLQTALKCWLLMYITCTSILFLKVKGIFKYLNIGYCIHLGHELKNIKMLFWNSSQTWLTSRIPHDTFVPLWQDTETWS